MPYTKSYFVLLLTFLLLPLFLTQPGSAQQLNEQRTFLITKESFTYQDNLVYRSKSTSEVKVTLVSTNTTHVTYLIQDPSQYSMGYPVNVTTPISIHNYQFIGHYNDKGKLQWLEYELSFYRNPVAANYPLTSAEFTVLSKTTWELFRPNVTKTLVTFSLRYTEYRDNQKLTVLAEFNTVNDESGFITSSEIYLNKKDETGKIIEEYFYRIETPTLVHKISMYPIFAVYGDIFFVLFILVVFFVIAGFLKRDNLKEYFLRKKPPKKREISTETSTNDT